MKIFGILITLVWSISLYAQNLDTIATLSSTLNEISGIDQINANTFVCHNDGGNDANIFFIDQNGSIINTLHLDSTLNIDFEDLCIDDNDNLYIADLGNNNFNRTNLAIYKISNISSYIGVNDTIVPGKISISYLDQLVFPDPDQNTDCESIAYYNDSLYIFSKNWSGNNVSKIYKLPTDTGTYAILPYDSIVTTGFITGADVRNDTLVLLQMGGINLYTGFSSNTFSTGNHQYVSFAFSQKEAVCFSGNRKFFIAQEDNSLFPLPILYELDLLELSIENLTERNIQISIHPNPLKSVINLPSIVELPSRMYVYSISGKLLLERHVPNRQIHLNELSKGAYILRIHSSDKTYISRILKLD